MTAHGSAPRLRHICVHVHVHVSPRSARADKQNTGRTPPQATSCAKGPTSAEGRRRRRGTAPSAHVCVCVHACVRKRLGPLSLVSAAPPVRNDGPGRRPRSRDAALQRSDLATSERYLHRSLILLYQPEPIVTTNAPVRGRHAAHLSDLKPRLAGKSSHRFAQAKLTQK